MMQKNVSQGGFTLIELIVSIVVGLLFILSSAELSGTIVNLSATGNQRTVATDLAYSNLRLYVNGRTPSWFINCDAANPNNVITLIDSSAAVTNLPPPVRQLVTATAPYGCDTTKPKQPIRVESVVTYGPSATEVRHASYATF